MYWWILPHWGLGNLVKFGSGSPTLLYKIRLWEAILFPIALKYLYGSGKVFIEGVTAVGCHKKGHINTCMHGFLRQPSGKWESDFESSICKGNVVVDLNQGISHLGTVFHPGAVVIMLMMQPPPAIVLVLLIIDLITIVSCEYVCWQLLTCIH